jgi:hypothetical protein
MSITRAPGRAAHATADLPRGARDAVRSEQDVDDSRAVPQHQDDGVHGVGQ